MKSKKDQKDVVEKKEIKKTKSYRSYKSDDKALFFFYVYEKQLSVRTACKMAKIPPSTSQNWYKKGLESLEKDEDLPHVK